MDLKRARKLNISRESLLTTRMKRIEFTIFRLLQPYARALYQRSWLILAVKSTTTMETIPDSQNDTNPFDNDDSSECESVSGSSSDGSELSEDFVENDCGENELVLVAKGEVRLCDSA